MTDKNYYKISELSRIASVPVTTIRFYLREGMLAPPVKTGKTMAFYTDEHIDRLMLIKKIRSDEGKTIAQAKVELGVPPASPELPGDGIITSSRKRGEIIDAAITLFTSKGLGSTSIDDIIEEAHIGKGTFYRYFKDKNELFIECADSVFHRMYRTVWNEIKEEKDMEKRLRKRMEAFVESYPKWIDMMNLVRCASVGGNQVFTQKFRAVLDQIVRPIARDLEVMKREKLLREEIDCLEAAYIIMGMAEFSAGLIHAGKITADEVFNSFITIITEGLEKK